MVVIHPADVTLPPADVANQLVVAKHLLVADVTWVVTVVAIPAAEAAVASATVVCSANCSATCVATVDVAATAVAIQGVVARLNQLAVANHPADVQHLLLPLADVEQPPWLLLRTKLLLCHPHRLLTQVQV